MYFCHPGNIIQICTDSIKARWIMKRSKVDKFVLSVADKINQRTNLDIAALAASPVGLLKGKTLRRSEKQEGLKPTVPIVRAINASPTPRSAPRVPPPRPPLPRVWSTPSANSNLSRPDSLYSELSDTEYIIMSATQAETQPGLVVSGASNVDPSQVTLVTGAPLDNVQASANPSGAIPTSVTPPVQGVDGQSLDQATDQSETWEQVLGEEFGVGSLQDLSPSEGSRVLNLLLFRGIVMHREPVPWEAIRSLSDNDKEKVKRLYSIADIEQLKNIPGLVAENDLAAEALSRQQIAAAVNTGYTSTPRRSSSLAPPLANPLTPISHLNNIHPYYVAGAEALASSAQTGARARSQDRTYVFPGSTKGGQSNVRFEDDQQYEWSTYVPWVENPPPRDRTQLINQEISVPAPNITAINRTVGTLNYLRPDLNDVYTDEMLTSLLKDLQYEVLPRLASVRERPDLNDITETEKLEWAKFFGDIYHPRCLVKNVCSHHKTIHQVFYTTVSRIRDELCAISPDMAQIFHTSSEVGAVPPQTLHGYSKPMQPMQLQGGSHSGGQYPGQSYPPQDMGSTNYPQRGEGPPIGPSQGGSGGFGPPVPGGSGGQGGGDGGPSPPPPPAGPGAAPHGPPDPSGNLQIQVLQGLVRTIDRLNSSRATISEGRFQAALKTLAWFSGQHPSYKKDIHPEATNLEADCDRWITYYRYFLSTQNLDPVHNRRAFFERLTGSALTHMRYHQPTSKSINELIGILRLRFTQSRTFDEVMRRLDTFSRRRYEDIATFMSRYDECLVDLRCVDSTCSLESKASRKYQFFLSQCTDIDLREKLRLSKLDNPANIELAMSEAQKYYNTRNKSPWAHGLDSKDRGQSTRNKGKGAKSVNMVGSTEDDPELLFICPIKGEIIKCYSCGELGHRMADCLTGSNSKLKNIQPHKPDPKTDKTPQSNNPPRKCTLCGKNGHTFETCFKLINAMKSQLGIPTGSGNNSPNNQGRGGGGGTPSNQTRNPQNQNNSNNNGRGRGRGRGRGQNRPRGGNSRAVNNVTSTEEDVDTYSQTSLPSEEQGDAPDPGN